RLSTTSDAARRPFPVQPFGLRPAAGPARRPAPSTGGGPPPPPPSLPPAPPRPPPGGGGGSGRNHRAPPPRPAPTPKAAPPSRRRGRPGLGAEERAEDRRHHDAGDERAAEAEERLHPRVHRLRDHVHHLLDLGIAPAGGAELGLLERRDVLEVVREDHGAEDD